MSGDEMMTVRREIVERLFDAVVGSMDFGSGFLETDDVACLREVAVMLGQDPMKGTPSEFAKRIKHPFEATSSSYPSYRLRCVYCGQVEDDHLHRTEVIEDA